MSDAIDTFFGAWSVTDADERRALIANAIADDFTYADPRSNGRLSDLGKLDDYVGMFSTNAPGWTATVEKSDGANGFARAVVAFGGKGPDGAEMVQHGTYFAETDDDGKLTLLVGFVGTGVAG